jgi:hypothetical protein
MSEPCRQEELNPTPGRYNRAPVGEAAIVNDDIGIYNVCVQGVQRSKLMLSTYDINTKFWI